MARKAVLMIFALFVLGAGYLQIMGCGAGGPGAAVAAVKGPQGSVQARPSASANFNPAKDGDQLAVGGAVKTGENSETRLAYTGKGEVTVKAESYFEVGSGESLGKQTGGTALFKIQKQKEDIKVETPQGVTAVLGTVFALQVNKDGTTTVVVDEGKVSFTNQHGSQAIVNPGEQLTAKAEGQLPAPVKIDPIAREQWFKGGAAPGLNQR